MSERLNHEARQIRKLMREAEGVTDEGIVAYSKLKQAMIGARAMSRIEVGEGQAALMRLNRAEQHMAAAYGDLLRVHAELSDIAIKAGADEDIPTRFKEGGALDKEAEFA